MHLLQGFKSEVMKDEAGKEKMPKGKLGDQVEEWCQCFQLLQIFNNCNQLMSKPISTISIIFNVRMYFDNQRMNCERW